MKIVLSHPTGNSNVRALALALVTRENLKTFYTTVATFQTSEKLESYRSGLLKEFNRRNFDPVLKKHTRCFPWYELGRVISSKMSWNKFVKHEQGIFCVDSVYSSLDLYVARNLAREFQYGANAVYAYEDGALETFKQAKKLGMHCIYDLPIAYYETARKLMQEEAKRLPRWEFTLGGGIFDSATKLDRKMEELKLADVIIGPSSFVMDSLPQWASNKKQITSAFGSPEVERLLKINVKVKNNLAPLKVLFVGSMGQRKGLGDLSAAIKMLNSKHVELVVLGSMLESAEFYKQELPAYTYINGREHSQVLEVMRSCDVFCLPSIVEGRALVMQEAMSQGLPLIITPNTGGQDLIEEEKTGFLVPIRSPEAIAEKLEWFIINRSRIPQMSRRCREVAKKMSWEQYGNRIIAELEETLAVNS